MEAEKRAAEKEANEKREKARQDKMDAKTGFGSFGGQSKREQEISEKTWAKKE